MATNIFSMFNSQNATMGVNAEGGEYHSRVGDKGAMLKGPSHKRGGVNMNLTSGEAIFSKGWSINGKSIAKREQKRDRKRDYFIKRLNSKDIIQKNTAIRSLRNITTDSLKDLTLQMLASKGTMPLGTGNGTRVKAQSGAYNDGYRGYTHGTAPQGGLLPRPLPKDKFSNLQPGEYTNIAAGVFGGLLPLLFLRRPEPYPNFFDGFGASAQRGARSLLGDIDDQRNVALAQAERDYGLSRSSQLSRLRNSVASPNVLRSLSSAVAAQTDRGLADRRGQIHRAYDNLVIDQRRKNIDLDLNVDRVRRTGRQQQYSVNRRLADEYRQDQYSALFSALNTAPSDVAASLNRQTERQFFIEKYLPVMNTIGDQQQTIGAGTQVEQRQGNPLDILRMLRAPFGRNRRRN